MRRELKQIIEKRICSYISLFVVSVCLCPCATSTSSRKATPSGSGLHISHRFQRIARKLCQTLDLFYRKTSTPVSRKVQWIRMEILVLFEGTYISKWMNCRKPSDQIIFPYISHMKWIMHLLRRNQAGKLI